jgi:FAD binding domain
VGDAAHSFPPTGGLGLNSGLGDAHNLAYKIAAVQSGWGAPSLLNTYQSDRQPVANVNSLQSVKNGKKIFGLLKALGTTASDITTARVNLYAAIRNPAQMKVIDAEIEAQREHFDNLELHIGYVYGSTEIPSNASNYTPKYIPGARLPHTWIQFSERSHIQHPPPVDVSYVAEFSDSDIQARQHSTLDLCAPDAFTLIVDGANSSNLERWKALAEQLKAYAWQKGIPINFRYSGVDFEVLPGAQGDAWAKGFGLEEGGGVLVRPDQHVLMVLGKDNSFQEVRRGLEAHLGL